jgi:transposase
MDVWAGLDVAKAKFDAALAWKRNEGEVEVSACGCFPRTLEGARRFLEAAGAALKRASGPDAELQIVMEATGSYSLELEKLLAASGLPARTRIVNPRLIHHYMKSLGLKNETDKIAASTIARYGLERNPPFSPALSKAQEKLRSLVRGRAALIKARTAIGEQLKATTCQELIASMARTRDFIAQEIEGIELQMASTIEEDQDMRRDAKLIDSIPGVGFINACAILGEFGDLRRFKKRGQLVAFAGLNCLSKESGSSVRRKSGISKAGPSEVRRVLYLAARASVMSSTPNTFAAFYNRKINEGKAKLSARTAIMRKILLTARAMLLKNEPFSSASS